MGLSRAIAVVLLLGLAGLGLASCSAGEASTSSDLQPRIIGFRGSSTGRFSSPRGIDLTADGRLAVVDRTGRIQIFSPEGEVITEWMIPEYDNGTPTGLIFDESDPEQTTLLIADTHYSRILRYSLDGELIGQFGEYGDEPGLMIYPTDIAVDGEGTLYITEYGGTNDRVMKFDREGNFIKEWGTLGSEPGAFQRPLGLVWDGKDRIIVADTCTHRLEVFTTEGELLEVWGELGSEPGQFNYPYDLTLGDDGLIYVAEYGNNRLQALNLKGESVALYGGPGTAPGQFHTPWGIAMGPGGSLYVADTNNHRLQVIKPEAMRRNES